MANFSLSCRVYSQWRWRLQLPSVRYGQQPTHWHHNPTLTSWNREWRTLSNSKVHRSCKDEGRTSMGTRLFNSCFEHLVHTHKHIFLAHVLQKDVMKLAKKALNGQSLKQNPPNPNFTGLVDEVWSSRKPFFARFKCSLRILEHKQPTFWRFFTVFSWSSYALLLQTMALVSSATSTANSANAMGSMSARQSSTTTSDQFV